MKNKKKIRRRLTSIKRKGGERTIAKLAGAKVRIWSDEHCAWWRPNGIGYTGLPDFAGVWVFEDAYLETQHCGPEKKIIFEVLS